MCTCCARSPSNYVSIQLLSVYVGNLAGSHVGVCLVMHLLQQLAYHDKTDKRCACMQSHSLLSPCRCRAEVCLDGVIAATPGSTIHHGRLGWHPDGNVTGQCEQKKQHAEGHTDHITTCDHRAHKRPHSRRSAPPCRHGPGGASVSQRTQASSGVASQQQHYCSGSSPCRQCSTKERFRPPQALILDLWYATLASMRLTQRP